ncbi:MAG: hydroxymethylpyrimidine transporter substrate-binding protein [Phycisphaerales bacterium]|nr:hydroxymethylpyrimidine transporter substrate-binding protein [Phycisphaerales bacterium]
MRRIPLSLLLLLAAIALPTGCRKKDGGTATTQAARTATLQLNWKPEAQFGGFYAAGLPGGAFAARGLDVTVTPGGVGTPTVQMVGAGRADFAVVSADEVVVARSNGNDVVALLAVYQDCPQGLMTRASRGFKGIGDVFKANGTVAMQKGLPYAQLLERQYGFDKVKVVPSPGGDVSVFLKDETFAQQCFVTSEPLAAKRAGVEPKTFLVKEAGYNPYTTVLVTRGELLLKDPARVRDVTQACKAGWDAYLADPAPANAAMRALNPGVDAATLAESAEVQKPLILTDDAKANGVGSMTLARWEELVRQLADLKVIDKAPAAGTCFVTPAALDAAAAGR